MICIFIRIVYEMVMVGRFDLRKATLAVLECSASLSSGGEVEWW